MYAQELLIHNRGQRQGTEGFDTSIVDPFRVLVLALELKGKVVSQVPALVIAPK